MARTPLHHRLPDLVGSCGLQSRCGADDGLSRWQACGRAGRGCRTAELPEV